MNEIVVLSGKGGTGKTSITAAFAVLAGKNAIIADCDVDAANMHLLLKPDFEQTVEFYSGVLAIINNNQCDNCGLCAKKCRFNAISFINGMHHVNNLDCDGCGYCEKICPNKAINLIERKSGQLFISQIRTGAHMVHARLFPGAENSGKLVAKVKNEAKNLALSENRPFVIIDGSPGIGCPVVSSLSGASYVIFVTEPTISGIHDLKRVHSVVSRFRIKSGCIINKWDLNEENTREIKAFLIDRNIDHLADIPYDVRFTQTMVQGKTIVEVQSPAKSLLESIWKRVAQILINQ
jgi:MinD superfamily P-loop ATPase